MYGQRERFPLVEMEKLSDTRFEMNDDVQTSRAVAIMPNEQEVSPWAGRGQTVFFGGGGQHFRFKQNHF